MDDSGFNFPELSLVLFLEDPAGRHEAGSHIGGAGKWCGSVAVFMKVLFSLNQGSQGKGSGGNRGAKSARMEFPEQKAREFGFSDTGKWDR